MNLFEKSPIVSYTSIERITNGKKATKQYAKQLINNLIKKNKFSSTKEIERYFRCN